MRELWSIPLYLETDDQGLVERISDEVGRDLGDDDEAATVRELLNR